MRRHRVLIGIGLGLLLIAISLLLAGPAQLPIVPLLGVGLGVVLLVAGLRGSRNAPDDRGDDVRSAGPSRGEKAARVVVATNVALAVVASIAAILVAVGAAQGHAVFHLLTGLVALGLFAALAFLWHPTPGSGPSMVRGLTLGLLALASFGSFVESLGGAGYDAANAERRLPALASLHGVGQYFGAFVMVGVPLGIVTGLVVLIAYLRGPRTPLTAQQP